MKCDICGREMGKQHNNPQPLLTEDKSCCNECNRILVVPFRIATMNICEKSLKENNNDVMKTYEKLKKDAKTILMNMPKCLQYIQKHPIINNIFKEEKENV